MKFLAVALAAAALGVGGGWLLFERLEDDDEVAASSTWNTCSNPKEGFAIDYPAAWYTDHPTPELACFFFDPRRFEVPRDSDFTGTALEVQRGSSFDETVNGYTDPMYWSVRDRAEIEAEGRRVFRFEAVATGEGLLDRGAVIYGYVLDGEPNVLAVVTHSSVGIDYTPWKRIVDRAVRTLRFTPRSNQPILGADVVPPQAGLPVPVARKRAQIWRAARHKDSAALARLIDPKGFEYTFGGAVPGGPTAYWRRLEKTTEERPIETLAAILDLPYVHQPRFKLYVWPFAFTRKASSLSIEEKEQLAEAIGEESLRLYEQVGNYLGYRAGIDEDGNWVFYVAGD